MSSLAGSHNIIVDQGATFSQVFIKKDSKKRVIPLTGFTARMQVRQSYDSPETVLNLTTENDGIIIDETKGMINILVPAATMTNISGGKYVYDLELVDPDGAVERLVMGSFTVRAEVTR